ncbi:glycosyltransferase [Vreelandella aquamarina]
MFRQPLIQWVFYLNLVLITALLVYKTYLNFFEQDFAADHARQVSQIEQVLQHRERYRFAVVGNINNSVGIFEHKIISQLNAGDYDFLVSAGNAVASGGEDKYQALFGTLEKLSLPYLLTFGPMEESRLGGFRFYDHFGPYHFSFAAGDTRFIFLDSTGTTDFGWQLRWLKEITRESREKHQLLFSANPFYPVETPETLTDEDEQDYLFDAESRASFIRLIEQSGIDVVFSAQLPLYDRQHHASTDYVVTGGAGGLVINNEHSYPHFVAVEVDGASVTITEQRLDTGQHPFWRTLESLWFFIYSLFYVSYLNFILIISSFIALAIWLFNKIFTEQDYYPDFDQDPNARSPRPLKVVMFTNNYLPFIGGVPISIERLRRGLMEHQHEVLVVAPQYLQKKMQKETPKEPGDEHGIVRLSSLLPLGGRNEFRLANIFSWRMLRRVRAFTPDVIHVHHPFWLGRAGQLIAKALRIPVVYTYHTRLEHYAHYVPLPGPLFRNLISHSVVKRFANRCDGIIVPTSSAEEYLRLIGVKKPIFVQPTGIEHECFATVDADACEQLRQHHQLHGKRVLVSISRLSKEKNIDFMLEGMALLRDETSPDVHLLIIGEGHDRPRLEANIKALGLSQHVTLTGAVPPEEVATYCQLATLFVFASRSETQGMVVLEAMAAGLPVVVIRSSGIEDIVEHGVNGYKTAPSIREWSHYIDSLLHDEPQRQRMSQNATQCAARHGIAHFSDAVAGIYYYVICHRHKLTSRKAD